MESENGLCRDRGEAAANELLFRGNEKALPKVPVFRKACRLSASHGQMPQEKSWLERLHTHSN